MRIEIITNNLLLLTYVYFKIILGVKTLKKLIQCGY